MSVAPYTLESLETPALLVVETILHGNLERIAGIARRHAVRLRPHVKTHKCPSIACLQEKAGTVGFTVATLGEAEALFDAGCADLFIAYPIVGEGRLRRFASLLKRGRLIAAVDHPAQLPLLDRVSEMAGVPIELRIEIDCGHHRCGLVPGPELVALGREITAMKRLRLEGVFTHAGHAYGATSPQHLEAIGRAEGEAVVAAARLLAEAGIDASSISAGSTPTLPFCSAVPGVTEVRPGNYVFNDGIQVALGVATPEQCALRVLATVISVFPDRFIIDAGSKAFGLDKGAHGLDSTRGYGRIVGFETFELARLSEEHGIVLPPPANERSFPKIGDRLQIIPNHACAAANLNGRLHLVDEKRLEIKESWPVLGRR